MQIAEATKTFKAPPADPKLGTTIRITEGTIGEVGSPLPDDPNKRVWIQFAREHTGSVWIATDPDKFKIVA
jgi:hypothetical protein